MNCVKKISAEQADARVGEIYAELLNKRGKASEYLQTHSLRPISMLTHMALYLDILYKPGGLTRQQREMIAIVVSRENNCDECVAHHVQALSAIIGDKQVPETIAQDHHKLDLSAADRALLDYAVKLTHHPQSELERETAQLRKLGVSDDDILLARLTTAYFNLINRTARELGMPPESNRSSTERR